MFKLSDMFSLGSVLFAEVKEAISVSARFGRMHKPRASAALLLKAYAMYWQSKRTIQSLER